MKVKPSWHGIQTIVYDDFMGLKYWGEKGSCSPPEPTPMLCCIYPRSLMP